MQVKELEDLSSRLQRLQQQLKSASAGSNSPLREDDPLVVAALECEFMLPSILTMETLTETVEKKINNVNLLLERARRHESLPEDAQVAADQEYLATEEDLAMDRQQHLHQQQHPQHPQPPRKEQDATMPRSQ
jgi:hypothetical protein